MIKKILKAPFLLLKEFFFDSDGTFNPVYFWTTCFLTLIVITWILKLDPHSKVNISDYLLLGLLTFVIVWVGLYNKQKKDVMNCNHSPQDSTTEKIKEIVKDKIIGGPL